MKRVYRRRTLWANDGKPLLDVSERPGVAFRRFGDKSRVFLPHRRGG